MLEHPNLTGAESTIDMQLTWAVFPELLVTLTVKVCGVPWTELPDLAVSVVCKLLPAVRSATL